MPDRPWYRTLGADRAWAQVNGNSLVVLNPSATQNLNFLKKPEPLNIQSTSHLVLGKVFIKPQ